MGHMGRLPHYRVAFGDKMTQEKQPIPPHMETDWFQRPEYIPERLCTCQCGRKFKSQARDIQFLESRPQVTSGGMLVLDKNGNKIMELVTVNGFLSYFPCPDCGRSKIAGYEALAGK